MNNVEQTKNFLARLERMPAAGWSDPWAEGANRAAFSGASKRDSAETWKPADFRPNETWSADGGLLRARAWDLYNNNPFASAAINAYIANVVSTGFLPERDQAFESAFNRWGGLDGFATCECDLARDNTILELQASWLRELLVGGGVLTNFVYLPYKSQRIPFAIELIGEERFADDVVISGRNSKTSNAVTGGVEVDIRTGRTVAFWVYPAADDLSIDYGSEPIRISAESARYKCLGRKSGAKRGTTLLRTAVLWLHALGYYVDNELFASNLKSMFAYVLSKQNGLSEEGELLGTPGFSTLDGDPVQRVSRGMVYQATNGGKIEVVGPNVPQEGSVGWIKLLQNAISIAVDLSYEEVFRDYGKSTLGTLRVSGNADRKRFEPLQQMMLCHFCNPVLSRFDAEAVSAGIPGFPSAEEYVSLIDDLLENQEWLVPGWLSPNPVDDAKADTLNLANFTDSRHQIIRRRGGSISKRFEELQWEQKELAGLQPKQDQQSKPVSRKKTQ